MDGTCQFGRILPKPDEISEHLEPCRGANLLLRLTPHFARWYFPESPFSAPVPWNCIAPEADCEAKRTFAPKKPAIAEEKPGDSLPSLPRPPHREPSKSIAPTPIHPPLPSVIRIRGIAGRSASLPEAATARSCATSPRTVLSSGVLPPTSASNTAHALPVVRPSSPAAAASWSETSLRCRLEEPTAATGSPGCRPEC